MLHPTQVEWLIYIFFIWTLTNLNLEFSISLTGCLIKVKDTSLPYYLLIDGGSKILFIPFPRILVLSRILTC